MGLLHAVDEAPAFRFRALQRGTERGSVWFIDGVNDTTAYPVEGRNCTIPVGTALFLALKASNYDNTNCNGNVIQPTTLTEQQLRENAATNLTGNYGDRMIIIDGVEVNGLPPNCNSSATCQSPYRVQTPVINYTVPVNENLLDVCYNPTPNNLPYTVTGAVGDGVYVMIKPLAVGKHTIQFGRPNLLRVYNITVESKN